MSAPTACLADRVSANTIEIQGIPVSLTKIAGKTGIELGYLSRIFSGKAKGSVATIKLIAEALGMPMEVLIDSLPGKKTTIPGNTLETPLTER